MNRKKNIDYDLFDKEKRKEKLLILINICLIRCRERKKKSFLKEIEMSRRRKTQN